MFEDPRAAVLREVKEEYCCDGVIENQLTPVSMTREWNGKKTHWLSIPFIIRVNPSKVEIGDKKSIDEIGWFKLNKFPKPQHSGCGLVLNYHKEIFAKYI